MSTLIEQYEALKVEYDALSQEINELKQDEKVKKYLELSSKEALLSNQMESIYKDIKVKRYDSCHHIWAVTQVEYDAYEGRRHVCYGCIKCGLDTKYLDCDRATAQFAAGQDGVIMHDYLMIRRCSEYLGLKFDRTIDFDLAHAIYSKIIEAHPGIDDATAMKYMNIALDNMKHINVNDARRRGRAKRLGLHPDFNSFWLK